MARHWCSSVLSTQNGCRLKPRIPWEGLYTYDGQAHVNDGLATHVDFDASGICAQDMEERQKKEDEVLRLRQAQYDEEQRQLALVQQGMQKARTKVLAPGAAIEPLLEQSKATQPPSSMLDAPVDLPGSSALIESRSEPSVPASTSSIPYVVVDTVVPDMGAMAWPTAATVVPAVHSTSAHAEAVPCSPFPEAGNGNGGQATAITAVAPSEDDAEALARLARLQGFVSGTMSGGMSPLEAYKAQRQ